MQELPSLFRPRGPEVHDSWKNLKCGPHITVHFSNTTVLLDVDDDMAFALHGMECNLNHSLEYMSKRISKLSNPIYCISNPNPTHLPNYHILYYNVHSGSFRCCSYHSSLTMVQSMKYEAGNHWAKEIMCFSLVVVRKVVILREKVTKAKYMVPTSSTEIRYTLHFTRQEEFKLFSYSSYNLLSNLMNLCPL